METSGDEISKIVTPQERARTIFKKELRPVRRVAQQADTFVHLVKEYERTINIGLADKPNEDIVNSSWDVVRMQGLKKGSQDQDSAGGEDEVIQKSAQKVFEWFNERFGGMSSILKSYVGEDVAKQHALQQAIGRSLAKCVTIRTGLGKGFKQELQKKSVDDVANFLLENSDNFADLKKTGALQEDAQLERLLVDRAEEFLVSQETAGSVLELNQDVRLFELREWIANTSQEARRGKKIYETSYYKKLLDELRFQSRKKNGVGGVILYGPPGTGKTELAQEKNKQQGYRTTVINIHHYSSFNDLIADKPVAIGLDRGASTSQRLKTVIDTFANETPEGFKKDFLGLFAQLRQEGKLSEQTDIGSFLRSLVPEDVDLNDPASFDWAKIRDGFVQRQRSGILRTSLGESYQEDVQDIIRGQIFLAIENGQRVVLDELDKGGPNSLGGILGFLAKSPGETFEYGQMKVKIPPWFIVDATSNSSQLNEYLKDRFTDLEVSTPPVKDQLMIAAVRLADTEGNILLTDYEQKQLVGFFTYMVPNVNRILTANHLSPLSNRRIQELTSYLVDFGSMQRTDISFGSAVSKLFQHNSTLMGNEGVAKELNELLKSYREMLQDEPVNLRDQKVADESKPNKKREFYEQALKHITSSPVLVAIDGLSETGSSESGMPSVLQATLNQEQKENIEDWLRKKSEYKRPSMRVKKLSIGFNLQEETGTDKNSVLRVAAAPEDIYSRIQTIQSDIIHRQGEVVEASDDGKVVVMRNKSVLDSDIISIFRTGQNKNKDLLTSVSIQAGQNPLIQMDAKGKYIGVLNKNNLDFYGGLEFARLTYMDSVKRFQIAPNGTFALVESTNGKTDLVQIGTGNKLALLPGSSWSIVGNNLIVQENNNKITGDKAFVMK